MAEDNNGITYLGNQDTAHAMDNGMYMKLLVIVLRKYKLKDIVITPEDIAEGSGKEALIVGFKEGNIQLGITDMATAIELGKLHDGSNPVH